MKIANQAVLVTGAGGFIGSHLTEALVRAGARTRALVNYNSRGTWGHLDSLHEEVRSQIEVIVGDVRDAGRVRQAVASCEVVFHLAALIGIPYSYRAAQSYLQTNVEGTLNVLSACLESGVERLIHTSTSEVYGTPQYTPIDEAHRLNAQSPYAATKLAADQLALSFHASFDLPVVVVRPFNTYGPRQSARGVIPTIIAQALAGGPITLGSTDTVRDFLFVSDNVRGYLAASEAADGCGEVVQLGTGTGTSIAEVVELVGRIVGRPLEITTSADRRRPEKSEVRTLICCPGKALKLLNWQPQVNLESGLRQTCQWIDAHRDDYRRDHYAV
ncbi:MAG: SDR family NAD(P)-dependent oxidoreductase [Planctomycetes bacterium]|nr:SDR family NAD(P)-dependent oxidoreductase [Planctomycetota bacterium]